MALMAPNPNRDRAMARYQESKDALARSADCYRLKGDPPIIEGSYIVGPNKQVLNSGNICSASATWGDTAVIGPDGKATNIKRILPDDREQFLINLGARSTKNLEPVRYDI
jgi:hypothetical protein